MYVSRTLVYEKMSHTVIVIQCLLPDPYFTDVRVGTSSTSESSEEMERLLSGSPMY